MAQVRLFKYALAVVRDGRLLLCRPHAFPDLIMPGGVRERGESHLQGLRREISEELGPDASLDERSLEWFGRYEDQAAGKVDTVVEMDVFLGEVRGALVASSEIAELVWVGPDDDPSQLSAIVRNHVLPALRSRELL
jgi:8-oxo-dGTP diphosphatase